MQENVATTQTELIFSGLQVLYKHLLNDREISKIKIDL